MGRTCCSLILAAMLLAPAVLADQPTAVVIADFETGVGAWRSNDGRVSGARPAELCAIYATAREVDGKVEQAALIEFKPARDTWASVRLPVSGQTWLQHGVGQIAMWLRGDGSNNTVDLTLRSLVGPDRRDVSYVYKLSLENRQWERRAIRLFAFQNRDGQPLDAEALRGVYLIQFVKTGSWPALSFAVDDIYAEVVPGLTIAGPTGPETVVAQVDFRQVLGPMRGQVGLNLGPELPALLEQRSTAERARAAIRSLAPCLIRTRLSDYYRPGSGEYDLILLNRALNWIADAGGTPLVCLDPGPPSAGASASAHYQSFVTTAIKLVSLRRGGPTLRRYELFDAPLASGQFRKVSELVAAYNDLARRVLAADPEARVGGPGFASAAGANLRDFVQGAETLHFLSLQFHGAHAASATPSALFDAALSGRSADLPDQLSLVEVAELARSREPMPEVYVTALAPSSTPDAPLEPGFAAAWWAAALVSASPYADRLLPGFLIGGLLTDDGNPLPALQAVALLASAAPRGSTLNQLALVDAEMVTAALWTPKSRNLVVVYAGVAARTVVLDCRGAGVPLAVRSRILGGDGKVQTADRPISPRQSVEFTGPGVAVIEFVTDL